MSAHIETAGHGAHGHDDHGHDDGPVSHSTFKGYMTGFVLAVIVGVAAGVHCVFLVRGHHRTPIR